VQRDTSTVWWSDPVADAEKIVWISCTNPDCDNLIPTTREQKRIFFTDHFLKYNRIELPYCSRGCRQAHQHELNKGIQKAC
jgi:hypothetical protein